MQNLSSLMKCSYREHPAFAFGVDSWNLSLEKLSEFNATYEAAKHFRSTLTAGSRDAMVRDLMRALDSVFDLLQPQSNDEYEEQFIVGLKTACKRLIHEEFAWYAKQTHRGSANLVRDQVRRCAISMQQDRYFFGCLSKATLAELQDLAKAELGQFRANAVVGRLKREDLSINSGATVRAIRAVLNREFEGHGVLDAISAYAGRKMRVTGVSLELSLPQATWWQNAIPDLERPPQTLYAHLDESISCPKSIVYLSDVAEENGPTGCYPGAYEALQLNNLQELIGRIVGTVGAGQNSVLNEYYAKQYHQSVGSENFRRHFMRLPECVRFNSHMGWDVLPGSELESALAESEIKMTGPAGTFITFDGARLFHRGGLMREGERLALQVIFSDLTFAQLVVRKLKRVLS